MDKNFEISMLLDFYGSLLTERQYQCIDLHFNSDCSLAEIGEELNISRQGVHDNIKKGKNLLLEFEDKLGLLNRFIVQKKQLKNVLGQVENIESSGLPIDIVNKLESLKQNIQSMID